MLSMFNPWGQSTFDSLIVPQSNFAAPSANVPAVDGTNANPPKSRFTFAQDVHESAALQSKSFASPQQIASQASPKPPQQQAADLHPASAATVLSLGGNKKSPVDDSQRILRELLPNVNISFDGSSFDQLPQLPQTQIPPEPVFRGFSASVEPQSPSWPQWQPYIPFIPIQIRMPDHIVPAPYRPPGLSIPPVSPSAGPLPVPFNPQHFPNASQRPEVIPLRIIQPHLMSAVQHQRLQQIQAQLPPQEVQAAPLPPMISSTQGLPSADATTEEQGLTNKQLEDVKEIVSSIVSSSLQAANQSPTETQGAASSEPPKVENIIPTERKEGPRLQIQKPAVKSAHQPLRIQTPAQRAVLQPVPHPVTVTVTLRQCQNVAAQAPTTIAAIPAEKAEPNAKLLIQRPVEYSQHVAPQSQPHDQSVATFRKEDAQPICNVPAQGTQPSKVKKKLNVQLPQRRLSSTSAVTLACEESDPDKPPGGQPVQAISATPMVTCPAKLSDQTKSAQQKPSPAANLQEESAASLEFVHAASTPTTEKEGLELQKAPQRLLEAAVPLVLSSDIVQTDERLPSFPHEPPQQVQPQPQVPTQQPAVNLASTSAAVTSSVSAAAQQKSEESESVPEKSRKQLKKEKRRKGAEDSPPTVDPAVPSSPQNDLPKPLVAEPIDLDEMTRCIADIAQSLPQSLRSLSDMIGSRQQGQSDTSSANTVSLLQKAFVQAALAGTEDDDFASPDFDPEEFLAQALKEQLSSGIASDSSQISPGLEKLMGSPYFETSSSASAAPAETKEVESLEKEVASARKEMKALESKLKEVQVRNSLYRSSSLSSR